MIPPHSTPVTVGAIHHTESNSKESLRSRVYGVGSILVNLISHICVAVLCGEWRCSKLSTDIHGEPKINTHSIS